MAAESAETPTKIPVPLDTSELFKRLMELHEETSSNSDKLLSSVVELLAKLTDKGKHKHEVPELVKQKGFDSLTVFNGIFGDWDPWKTKLEAFLGQEHGYQELLEWAQQQKMDITMEMVEEYGQEQGVDAKTMAQNLWSVFIHKTEGQPYVMAKNVDEKMASGLCKS